MRYCEILALPCAVLRYSYPPYALLNDGLLFYVAQTAGFRLRSFSYYAYVNLHALFCFVSCTKFFAVLYLLCWLPKRGMVLVCTRRFRFLNFTIFSIYFIFILFFFTFYLPTTFTHTHTHTHDPRPLPTTHDPRHLATLNQWWTHSRWRSEIQSKGISRLYV